MLSPLPVAHFFAATCQGGNIASFAVSPDGSFVAVSDATRLRLFAPVWLDDSTVSAIRVKLDKEMASKCAARTMTFTHDNLRLVVACLNKPVVRVFCIRERQIIYTVRHHLGNEVPEDKDDDDNERAENQGSSVVHCGATFSPGLIGVVQLLQQQPQHRSTSNEELASLDHRPSCLSPVCLLRPMHHEIDRSIDRSMPLLVSYTTGTC